MFYYTNFKSPIGNLTMVSDGESLKGLWIEGQKYFLGKVGSQVVEKHDLEIFNQTKLWLERYFDGQRPNPLNLKLAPEGSDFAKEVWRLLLEIPYGQTTTYGEIAKAMAKKLGKGKMSAQAIGGAVGHNPISIIIPCHRVVGGNGNLTGYAGGLNLKVKLLEYEGLNIDKFSLPKNSKK